MEKRKIPAVRFKGFEDDWEQRKVFEIAPLQRGFDLPSDDMKPGKYPVVMSNGIGGYHSECKAKGPGVVTGRSGTIGKVHYIETDYWPHNTALWVTNFKNNNPKFIYYFYQWLDLNRFGTGSGVPTLNRNDVHDTVVTIPSVNEQVKISAYLTKIDNLITLHQRKLEKLQLVKKSMLEKMFPKNGSKIPEIRFEGFTDDWEQRKLGEIISKYEDPVPTPHDGYYRLGIRSHAKGTFHSYVAKGQELEAAQMHRVAAGNFIVNITFGWEHAVAITDENDAGKLVSHRFPQFSFDQGMVPEFFRYVIVDEKFRHHLWLSSPGGAGRNRVLKIDEMLDYLMRFPAGDEQIKIAEFFRNLDHLITLHQRKLEKMKSFKKSLLEKLFVQ